MSDSRRHPNVINVDEAQETPMEKGKHRTKIRRLGAPAGAQMLGATHNELAPKSVSFPFHYHCATEEAVFVLSGSGIARVGKDRIPVRAGDFVAMPAGPDHPHQMVNDGDVPLVYLCISGSAQKVDVVGYPDSKKVAALAGTFEKPLHRFIAREGESVDYWEGEPDAT
ncbi:MAG TPA: cupin domain-containing protein [Polyangiaceae bacterium]|nr:cupin domain-containing protein [Polyangiaceae bacterium]